MRLPIQEKIVNYSAALNVIIVDASKMSTRLGEKWPVPIEVLPDLPCLCRFATGEL